MFTKAIRVMSARHRAEVKLYQYWDICLEIEEKVSINDTLYVRWKRCKGGGDTNVNTRMRAMFEGNGEGHYL